MSHDEIGAYASLRVEILTQLGGCHMSLSNEEMILIWTTTFAPQFQTFSLKCDSL